MSTVEKRILAITGRKIIDTAQLDDSFIFKSNAPLDDFFSGCHNFGYLRFSRQKNKLFWNLDLYVWKAQPRLSVSSEKTNAKLEEIIQGLPSCFLLIDNSIFNLFIETSKKFTNLEVVPWVATTELATSYEP